MRPNKRSVVRYVVWKSLVSHMLVLVLGASIGFTVACWALFPLRSDGRPKYQRGDFKRVTPIAGFEGFTSDPQWVLSCVGSAKDCGEPIHITEPSTLALLGIGLAIASRRRLS